MARQARYAIHVPTTDNLGQPLRDLAQAAHEHLFRNGAVEGSYIERGKVGNWRDYAPEIMDHLVTFAEDTPETDSHLKQAAQHIGQLANQEAVSVEKHGKDGPMLWIVDNPQWQEGQGAHPSAIQPAMSDALMDAATSDPQPSRASALDYLASTLGSRG